MEEKRLTAGLSTPIKTSFFFFLTILIIKVLQKNVVDSKQNRNETFFSTRYLFSLSG